jgi:hypothetical protein
MPFLRILLDTIRQNYSDFSVIYILVVINPLASKGKKLRSLSPTNESWGKAGAE